MNGAAQRWMVASIAATALVATAHIVAAADVTDADRVYRNYTRETATVDEGQVRVEVRGLEEQDDQNTRLNLLGFRLRDEFPGKTAERLTGGVIDLVTSYGFAKNAELGIVVPGYIQKVTFTDGTSVDNQDIGDVQLYTKFQRSVAEHCAVGAGVELSMPNGPTSKGFGTGDLGVNPVVSTRYQRGPIGVGLNAGYEMYGGAVPDVLNYGGEIIVRASSMYALRTEIAGRLFNAGGIRYHDLTILPGIDFNYSDMLTIRPTAMANGTDTALDWGLGLGVAMKF